MTVVDPAVAAGSWDGPAPWRAGPPDQDEAPVDGSLGRLLEAGRSEVGGRTAAVLVAPDPYGSFRVVRADAAPPAWSPAPCLLERAREVLLTGRPLVEEHAAACPDVLHAPGVLLLHPLRLPDGSCAVVAVGGVPPGRTGRAEVELAALADRLVPQLGVDVAGRERVRTALRRDRERIARDLHDLVIQQLYAAGLSLRRGTGLSSDELRHRAADVVDELDAAIRELRATIYELQRDDDGLGLEDELRDLADAASGLSDDLVVDVHVDASVGDLPSALRGHLVAVVREGLSNVVRHSGAGAAVVEVTEDAGALVVRLTDDGRGLAAAARRSGLVNLRRRAEMLGGALRVTPLVPGGGGTSLEWRVPLPG